MRLSDKNDKSLQHIPDTKKKTKHQRQVDFIQEHNEIGNQNIFNKIYFYQLTI